MRMDKMRTRFAPSPTGFMHVGNVRSALFPWLLARQNQGSFIVRIEDTDQARLVEGATEVILETLKWLGMDWDEGPDIGGPYGPYVQTKRRQTYLDWAQKLIDKGLAYTDPYTSEQVEAFRKTANEQKRPFLFREHRPTNPPQWDGSQPLRFKTPQLKRYSWHDAVMGDLTAGPEALDDFILIKSDGLPTYNFAHIVDDAEMQITHVIRGLEYISSIPKYLSLYEALEIKPPVLACLPHILTEDGKKKLGKRDGAKSIMSYRQQGILPEALLNFLASMGWNDGTEQEIFSKDELIAKFSLERVQRAGARFDEKRLLWMNGHYIRQLDINELYNRSVDFWPKTAANYQKDYKMPVLELVKDRLKSFSELPSLTDFFFCEPQPNLELIRTNQELKHLGKDRLVDLLNKTVDKLKDSDFSEAVITTKLNLLRESTDQPPKIIFSLIRIATTWAPFSPALAESLSILGRERTLQRLQNAISAIAQI